MNIDDMSTSSFTTTGVFPSNESYMNSTNVTTMSEDLFQGHSMMLTTAAAICCIIFLVLGIPGNLITIIALIRCKKVRNATAVFIINLSFADLISSCVNLPLAASMFWNRKWIHGEILCVVFPLFRYGLMAVSIFTVLAITINRYIMIGHPRLYPRMYQRKLLALMIFFIWMGAFGSLMPTLFKLYGKFGEDREIASCSILKDEKGKSPKVFLFLVAFLLPCVAIIVCYSLIFYIVRKATVNSRSSDLSTQSTVHHDNESFSPEQAMLKPRSLSVRPSMAMIYQKGKMTNKDKRLLWMILVIFGTFLLCYLPITIDKVLASKKAKGSSPSPLSVVCYVLIYATVCANPFIYCALSTEYRQAYKSLLLCRNEWNLSSRSNNSNKT